MNFLLLPFLIIVSLFLCETKSFQPNVPPNFYGSPEVFSGYLSYSEVFIEAFTLQDDHVSISGRIPKVEHELDSMENAGKK